MRLLLSGVLFFLLVNLPASGWGEDVLRVVYADNYAPRSWQEQGEMRGILIDLIRLALEDNMGIQVTHQGYPWARAQAMVEQGLADAFVTIPTEQRLRYTQASSEPVISFRLYIATRKDNPQLPALEKVKTLAELMPYRIVDYHGNGWARKALAGFRVQWLPDIPSLYPFLTSGHADVLLLSDRGVADMHRYGYGEKIVVLPQSLHTLHFHLCVRKPSPWLNLLADFDQVMRQLTEDGIVQQISNRYYQ